MHACDTAHDGRDATGVAVSSPRAEQVPKAPVIVDGHVQVHAGGEQGGVAGHVADLGQCPPAGQGAGSGTKHGGKARRKSRLGHAAENVKNAPRRNGKKQALSQGATTRCTSPNGCVLRAAKAKFLSGVGSARTEEGVNDYPF